MYDVLDNGIRYNPKWLAKVRAKRRAEKAAEEKAAKLDLQERAKKHRQQMRESLAAQMGEEAVRLIKAADERMARKNDDARSVRQIITDVAAEYGITYEQIVSRSMLKRFVVPRHIAIREIHRLKPHLSFAEIGRRMNRDHTTVLWAVGKTKKYNPRIDREIQNDND